jgi:hypothetical protein
MADADDSYALDDLGGFLRELRGGADLVMGNRFRGRIEPGAMPFLHRYVGNPALSMLGRLFFHIPVGDFHCGIRAFRRDRVLELGLVTSGMEFASEMVVRASLAELRIRSADGAAPGRAPAPARGATAGACASRQPALAPALPIHASQAVGLRDPLAARQAASVGRVVFDVRACSLTIFVLGRARAGVRRRQTGARGQHAPGAMRMSLGAGGARRSAPARRCMFRGGADDMGRGGVRAPGRRAVAAPADRRIGARHHRVLDHHGELHAEPDADRRSLTVSGAAVPDAAVLAIAVAVTYLPGLVLLAALSVQPGLLMVALAPAASVAVAGVVAVLVARSRPTYGPVALWSGRSRWWRGVALPACTQRRGESRDSPGTNAQLARGWAPLVVGSRDGRGGPRTPRGPGSWVGPLATRPQEHDMIMHLRCRHARTGRGAPAARPPSTC